MYLLSYPKESGKAVIVLFFLFDPDNIFNKIWDPQTYLCCIYTALCPCDHKASSRLNNFSEFVVEERNCWEFNFAAAS